MINFVDDFQMPGQQVLEEADWPFFQCFRKKGVAGIGECLLSDVPGLIPGEMTLINEDSHQFRDGDNRMGIIELDNNLFRKRILVFVFELESADNIPQGACHKEILLLEAQFFTLRRVIVRVKNFGYVLGASLLFHGTCIIPDIKELEIKLLAGPGPP